MGSFIASGSLAIGVFVLAAFSPCSTVHAQDDVIRGYENLQGIKPADFLGVPDPRSSLDAATLSGFSAGKVDVPHTIGIGAQVTLGADKFWRFPVESMEWKAVEFETVFNKKSSWWRDKTKNGDLLQHERGHIDITEILTRQVNALRKQILDELKKQPPLGNLFVNDTGQNEARAKAAAEALFQERMKMAAESVARRVARREVDQWRQRQSDYDTQTNHGQKSDKQKEWKRSIATLFASTPKGPQAESRSTKSIRFEAASKVLSFSDDVVTAVRGGSGADPIIDAAVTLPAFVLEGETSWHDLLFSAQGDQTVTIAEGSTVYLTGRLPYVIYSENAFLGIMSSVSLLDVTSGLIEDLQMSFDSGEAFLVGLQLIPDEDLAALTRGFTVSASTGFSNLIGQRDPVAEPSSLALLGIAALGLWAWSWRQASWRRGAGTGSEGDGQGREAAQGQALAELR